MKRILSVLTIIVLLVGLSLPIAMAAETPTVTLSSDTVEAGEAVKLTVSIQDNPGLAACLLYFYYDATMFTVDPEEDIQTAGAFRRGGLVCNSIETARQNGRYFGDSNRDGVLALWYSSSGTDVTANGELMTITIHVKDNVPSGTYEIGLGYSAKDTNNEQEMAVGLSVKSGSITVTGNGNVSEDINPPEPEIGKPETPVFNDIAGNWAQDYIQKAFESGLVNGYGNGNYGPDDTMTRSQFITILWRAMGEPEPKGEASFTDLDPKQQWYHKAITWAEEYQIINGIGNGAFDPEGKVSREQLATVLHRMSGGSSGMELFFSSYYDNYYTDSGHISNWAKNSVYWAIYQEVYCGEASVALGDNLAPRNDATRAQLAVMMVRYLGIQ